jgi:hypothetical protein
MKTKLNTELTFGIYIFSELTLYDLPLLKLCYMYFVWLFQQQHRYSITFTLLCNDTRYTFLFFGRFFVSD